ncbi:MAG: sugar acetyltransferase [Bacteroidetes bacterium 4572_77]|nr:MAG: sugar acetyltransferase [Bacteroidetes bacterium 4572_77]
MVFSSIIFILFFLPAFLIAYYIAPRIIKNYVLLVFSLVFYAWGAPSFILFLVPSTLINYFLVSLMNNSKGLKAKIYLSLNVSVNLGLLFYFKYANFFLENVNYIRDWIQVPAVEWNPIILPIGISFFTFQSITYSMDVYRKIHLPLKNPFNYMLYIMMFPQMIAGPIVRFIDIADQISARKEKWEDFLYGFNRFALGLAKKVLIADVLGKEVDRIMAMDYALLDSSTAWVGIVGYTFQLYFDFSGYSDMAIGIGRMIGFKFPENFNNPYVARSVTEFWRRWHITFSVFMKNYLYYPLGGSRVATNRRLYFNLWFIFLISGLWHGASWNFVIYGAFHGFFLVLERIFLLKWLEKVGVIPSVLFTFFIIVMARVFFRIEELDQAVLYFKSLFSFNFKTLVLVGKEHFYVMMAIATFFSFITLSKTGLWLQDIFYTRNYNAAGHIAMWILSIALGILSISSLTGFGYSPFIYFRF